MSESVNVGRPGPYGNPFRIGFHGTREEVVAKHRLWFIAPEQAWLRGQARLEFRGKPIDYLWCPGCRGTEPCHRLVIWEVANA